MTSETHRTASSRRSDAAVSDVIGTVLTTVIVVAVVAVAWTVVTAGNPPPEDPVSADLGGRAGSASLEMEHRGGERVPEDGTEVRIVADGNLLVRPLTAYAADYAAGDPDAWETGERLCISCLDAGTLTEVEVVSGERVVDRWRGSVTVPQPPVADFTFSCSLVVCDFDGTASSDPDGSIVAWSWDFGDGNDGTGATTTHIYGTTGVYTVTLTVTDDDGRTDDVSKDVQVSLTGGDITYVDSFTSHVGTVTDFANAQSADDDGAEATLTEEDTAAGTSTNSYDADAVVASGSGWSDGANAFASDDQYATNDKNNPKTITYGLADEADDPGTITKVVLRAELSITSHNDDDFEMRACLAGGSCSAYSGALGVNATDAYKTYDVTEKRPGGGSWTWSDVNDLQVELRPIKNGGRDGTWRIDHVQAQVTYDPPASYALDVEMAFVDVPTGVEQDLQLRYRVQNDTYDVQVWDGLAWNTRGDVLDATTATTWNHELSVAEYNGGDPRIRFLDRTPTGTAQGELFLDWVRVVTTT